MILWHFAPILDLHPKQTPRARAHACSDMSCLSDIDPNALNEVRVCAYVLETLNTV